MSVSQWLTSTLTVLTGTDACSSSAAGDQNYRSSFLPSVVSSFQGHPVWQYVVLPVFVDYQYSSLCNFLKITISWWFSSKPDILYSIFIIHSRCKSIPKLLVPRFSFGMGCQHACPWKRLRFCPCCGLTAARQAAFSPLLFCFRFHFSWSFILIGLWLNFLWLLNNGSF